jgi:hypothetical protein
VPPRIELRHDLRLDIPITIGMAAGLLTWTLVKNDVVKSECKLCEGEINAVDDWFRTALRRPDPEPAAAIRNVLSYGLGPAMIVARIRCSALDVAAPARRGCTDEGSNDERADQRAPAEPGLCPQLVVVDDDEGVSSPPPLLVLLLPFFPPAEPELPVSPELLLDVLPLEPELLVDPELLEELEVPLSVAVPPSGGGGVGGAPQMTFATAKTSELALRRPGRRPSERLLSSTFRGFDVRRSSSGMRRAIRGRGRGSAGNVAPR